jgi:hypothetical protein
MWSDNIGIKATPSAPAAIVKKKKSGILKAAKYASVLFGPVAGKLELTSLVRKKPNTCPIIAVATSSVATFAIGIRVDFCFRGEAGTFM